MKAQKYTILLSVAELWLKGKNQRSFVDRLLGNLRTHCARVGIVIDSLRYAQGTITLICDGTPDVITSTVAKIPGISTFSFGEIIPRDLHTLEHAVERIFDRWKKDGVTIVRFDTRRRDKTFALTSPQINARLGAVANAHNLKCDYKNAVHTVTVIVERDAIFLSHTKHIGAGGLPVGSSGRGLVLLSGGIDSPVAAVRMMRRGVYVDYVHFHSFAQNHDVLETKIPEIIQQLNRFAPQGAKLYSVPYTFFDLIVQEYVPQRMQVLFFKNFMHRFTQDLMVHKKYNMMITGDALAQVASQTPQNMHAAMYDIHALLLRPLVGMDKEEIINFSRQYGLYDQSIKPYKDCCSLVAKNPLTRVNYEKFKAVAAHFPMHDLIAQTREHMEVFDIA